MGRRGYTRRMPSTPEDDIGAVLTYHERSKHHPGRYAASPGYLDWANQPDPFRRFAGADLIPMPLAADAVEARYDDLYVPGAIAPKPMSAVTLGVFLELALGLSAWKAAGDTRWALRNNPSSGNLHPTEGYLVCPDLDALPSGVYHYAPLEHALEKRCACPIPLGTGSAIIGLTSIHWREAWKYGERAYRYCQHDAGHAIASICYAAAALGWTARALTDASDDEIGAILGIGRQADFSGAEDESPDVLIGLYGTSDCSFDVDAIVNAAHGGTWSGHANLLSATHHEWPVIEEVGAAARKPRTAATQLAARERPRERSLDGRRAVDVIRGRRSAQVFDPHYTMPSETFFALVNRLAPSGFPYDALPGRRMVHPVIAVNRVTGMAPGLYATVRDPAALDRLKETLSPDFDWLLVYNSHGVSLFRLIEGDPRATMKMISCGQDIAANGAFTLGMLAEFAAPIRENGAWWYRRLFWEAGMIGQALYLEAERRGVRGTGIGCYLDDAFHALLGVEGTAFQSVYHFTVGLPIDDDRLETLPPYAHLGDRRLPE